MWLPEGTVIGEITARKRVDQALRASMGRAAPPAGGAQPDGGCAEANARAPKPPLETVQAVADRRAEPESIVITNLKGEIEYVNDVPSLKVTG